LLPINNYKSDIQGFDMLQSIKNEDEYEKSLNVIYDTIQKDLIPNGNEFHELEALSILVEAYEK
jgi:antitoxin component HigA of HigAB toxin-antitoxin module